MICRIQNTIAFCVLSLVLVSCSSGTLIEATSSVPTRVSETSPATTTAEVVADSTEIPVQVTETLDPTNTAEPTPTFVRPEREDDFLQLTVSTNPAFSTTDADCLLPCWQGLTPGESDIEDVEAMMRTMFGYKDSFILDDYLGNGLPDTMEIEEGYSHYSETWSIERGENQNNAVFIFTAVFDDSQTLLGINLYARPYETYSIYNLPSILQALGPPDDMYVSQVLNRLPQVGITSLRLVYEEGLAILLNYVQEPLPDTNEAGFSPLCFDVLPETAFYYMTTPLPEDAEDLNKLQEDWLGEWGLKPTTEEAFGMIPEEFVDFVQSGNPCMDIDYPPRN